MRARFVQHSYRRVWSDGEAGLRFRVKQQVRLPVHLIGGIVSDVFKRKRPLPAKSTDLTIDPAPVLEVTAHTVVGDVAGLMGSNSDYPWLLGVGDGS